MTLNMLQEKLKRTSVNKNKGQTINILKYNLKVCRGTSRQTYLSWDRGWGRERGGGGGRGGEGERWGLFVGCLTSQQHASVSQGRICSDNFTCCHTEIEVADPTFYITQSQYTDTRPTSSSADPSQVPAEYPLECQFLSHWNDSTPKNPGASGIRTRDLLLSRQTPYH